MRGKGLPPRTVSPKQTLKAIHVLSNQMIDPWGRGETLLAGSLDHGSQRPDGFGRTCR